MVRSTIVTSVCITIGWILLGHEAKHVEERYPEGTLPNVKITDCVRLGLSARICLKITFGDDELVEYAELKEEEPGIDSILSGPLFTSDLIELDNSRVSVTLLEEGLDAQIMISGSEGTDELFQLKVNLQTGEAHVDTFPHDGIFHLGGDDEGTENRMTDEERRALLDQFNMDRQTMPAQLDFKVQVVIDRYFTEKYGSKSETRVAGVFNHMKTFFAHSSLQVKLNLVKLPTKTISEKIVITQSNLDQFGNIVAQLVSKGKLPDAHTYTLLSPVNRNGLYGIAYMGSHYQQGVCAKNVAYRVNINWYETNARYDDDLLTALTVVHEIGHNLGMRHDFDDSTKQTRKDSSGNNCKGISAFMDYVFPPYTSWNPMPNKWSGCSVEDFKAHYQLFKNRDGAYCMKEGGTQPPQPPTDGSTCTNIKLTTKDWGKEISWVFGSCSGKVGQYTDNKVYDRKCCQPAGKYDLKCTDSYGDGWNGGYIQIGSSAKKLCQDFKSTTTTVTGIAHGGGGGGGTKVCTNLKLTTKSWAEDISWEFGSCSSKGAKYENNKSYNSIKCCQAPGKYTMKCMDSYGDGWGAGAFIQVGSKKVCGDFTNGSKKEVKVNHPASARG